MTGILLIFLLLVAAAGFLVLIRFLTPVLLIWWNPAKYKEYEMKQLRTRREQEQKND